MFYYTVKKIGDGTEDNPYRPNYNGAYVWNPDFKCNTCQTYIIATTQQTDELEEITELQSACESRGLIYNDVLKWFVGDG